MQDDDQEESASPEHASASIPAGVAALVPGTLYVVATPIGNLEDLSSRAARILGAVDLIAAEDTRVTRGLLAYLGVHRPLVSCQEHNEASRIPGLLARLKAGGTVALVSDAGVPAISDPGFRLVREAVAEDIPVVGIPGPCAFVTALSIAGLPTDRFLFLGFPPHRSAKRSTWLKSLAPEPGTLVFYESPQRILETLDSIATVFPGRKVALARELTRRYEEVLRGTPGEVVEQLRANDGERLRGNLTLLVEGAGQSDVPPEPTPVLSASQTLKEISEQVASALGLSKKDVYRALARLKEQSGAEG